MHRAKRNGNDLMKRLLATILLIGYLPATVAVARPNILIALSLSASALCVMLLAILMVSCPCWLLCGD